LNRDRTEFDSLHCAPRLSSAFQDLYSEKSGILESSEKTIFSQRPGNASAPKLRIVLQSLGHFFITHNIANYRAPTFLQYAENLVEELPFRFWLHQIEHTIGNDHV